MKTSIFMPQKINVGFQNRSDTYTGKLAYIIYFDNKGVLRKETSWNSWRNKDIGNVILENVPMSGFVLNKKAGDYSTGWNHRQAYTRVYDPRNFEFEITIENLLYILENANSIKGKGLEGDFIYGWDGKDLILIPTESPDYKEISEFNKIIHNNETIKAKDLIIGATYKTNQNEEYVYMGKFDYYGWRSNGKKQFWFYSLANKQFTQLKSLGDKLIKIIYEDCYSEYADLFDELECKSEYSPVDESRKEYEYYDLDYFTDAVNKNIFNKNYYWASLKIYSDIQGNSKTLVTIERAKRDSDILKVTKRTMVKEKYKPYYGYGEQEREVERDVTIIESLNLEEIFNILQPMYKNVYLKNGKLRGGEKNNE